MMFYTNAAMIKNDMYVRGYMDGKRFQERIRYRPYLFVQNKNNAHTSQYRTLEGHSVDKIDFENAWEARQFIKRYEEVENFPVYGMTQFTYTFLNDEYPGAIQYEEKYIRTVNLDIETKFENGFPNPWIADQEVTAITLELNGKYLAMSTRPYRSSDPDVTYVKCADERDMLARFITTMRTLDPDIITGWNIEGFDIPYIYNRILRLLGQDDANRLSPWGITEVRDVPGSDIKVVEFLGVSIIDYLDLYKKFSFKNQESYKLGFIAQVELGESKVEYEGNLMTLFNDDFQKFMDYNIHDVRLVRRLDQKLGFIPQCIAIAYNAKINYLDAFTSVRLWDVIIHNFLLDQNIVVPTFNRNKKMRSIVGGFVKDPDPGMYKWIVSFDLNSLYPHLIMQYNISPETFVHQLPELRNPETAVDYILNGLMHEKKDLLKEYDVTAAASGMLFRRDRHGFLPQLMQKMYDDRTTFKNKMLTSQQELVNIEAEMKRRGLKK